MFLLIYNKGFMFVINCAYLKILTVMLKKFILSCFLLIIVIIDVNAQVENNKPSSVRAIEATEKLNQLVDQIAYLDRQISITLYGVYNVADIDIYNKRLALAENLIKQLDDIDKLFRDISESDPTEKDYLLKQAFTKIIELSIVDKKDDYLGFLKIIGQSKEEIINTKYNPENTLVQYEEKYSKWTIKAEKLIRESRNLLRNYIERDKNSVDALSLKIILLYYEKKHDEAIKEMTALIATRQVIDTVFNKSVLPEKYEGCFLAWLAYMHFENNNNAECYKCIDELRVLSEPEKSIFWSEGIIKHLVNKETKNHDVKIINIETPANVKFYTWRKLLYAKDYGKDVPVKEFNIQESQVKLNLSPNELFKIMNTGWEGLNKLELASWVYANTALTAEQGRPYNNPYTFYINIANIKKKKLITRQVSLFQERFDTAYSVLNKFRYARKCWGALIAANPDVSFYRVNRIKTDLALYYMSKNSETFLSVFNFMKVGKKRIDNTLLNSIEEEFKEPVESELQQDIDFLEKADPGNLLFIITIAEAASYINEPGEALKRIDDLMLKVKKGSTINGLDVKSYLELYRAYVYIRLGQFEELKKTIQILEAYPNFEKYIREFKTLINFKENEKLYKAE
jgi:hypothetical protein